VNEEKTYGHLFEFAERDMDAVMREKFANGQGVIQLLPGMNDAVLLAAIKYAVSVSNGKPFLVMPAAA